ncbi:MAG: DUF2461 domain-containing protein [Pirellulaceae bacterium]
MSFDGFSLQTLHFLDELGRNNHRDWFQANKARYEADVVGPALAFIAAFEKPLQKISPHFVAVPKKVGGSLMRIYRDTRFANDKRPYKTNIGIQFRHETGKDVHCPGFYLHIEPEQVFFGAGIWHPDGPTTRRIREEIVDYPDDWKKAVQSRSFRNEWELSGDSLQRAPRDFEPDHALIDDIKRKDFIAISSVEVDDLLSASLVKTLAAKAKKASLLVRFLCEAIRVDF